jgi:hypothetical protein
MAHSSAERPYGNRLANKPQLQGTRATREDLAQINALLVRSVAIPPRQIKKVKRIARMWANL